MGSLKAALKAFFPNNNGDTNFSSSCLVPYFDSSQNPKGCVTPSKLASVLGGLPISYGSNNNLNVDTFIKGIAYVNGVASGTWPWSTAYAYGSMLIAVPNYNESRVTQVVIRQGFGVYQRLRADGTWGDWTRVDSF